MIFSKLPTLLTAALLLATFPSFSTAAEPQTAQNKTIVKRVEVEDFDKLRAKKDHVVLDVRTEKEFNAGHIPGAIRIDANAPDFEKKVAELDRTKTYLVHCAAGVRSARACQKMQSLGFKELYDLGPGFRGWEKAGKPVEKPAAK